MTFLYLLSLVAILFQICFITVAVGKCNFLSNFSQRKKTLLIYLLLFLPSFEKNLKKTIYAAAGLYYVAELVEEYTVIAKKIITAIILVVAFIYSLFIFFDNLPWSIVICGLIAQTMHALIMTNFPYVKFASIPFVGALILLIINHWLAFEFFTANYYSLTEVSICQIFRFSINCYTKNKCNVIKTYCV